MKKVVISFVVVAITGFNVRSQGSTDSLKQQMPDSVKLVKADTLKQLTPDSLKSTAGSAKPQMADSVTVPKNLIKINLTGLFFGNYIAQYERIIGKRSSLALTVGIAPNTSLPFKQTLMDNYADNEDAKKAIESTKYTKYTFTLEYRYYLSKPSAPKGLYLAPFIRYMNMDLEQDYPFTPSDGKQHVATVSSKFGAFGAGLMLGAQWTIKKHWGIDFWMIGGFYGPQINAKFHGEDPIGHLSAQDMADLEEDIEGIDLPGYTVDATVTQDPSGKPAIVDAIVKGPYYGIRGAGFCVVYRF